MIQTAITLKKNQCYALKFKADLFEGNPLIIDLYGPGYNYTDQEILVYKANKPGFEEYLISFNSKDVPEKVNLRLFTYSKEPIHLKDIAFFEMKGEGSIFKKVYEAKSGAVVLENTICQERVRFASYIEPVKDVYEASNFFLRADEKKVLATACVEGIKAEQVSQGTVENIEYSDDYKKINIDVSTWKSSFLILADTWYPGWKAYVDNKEVTIYKTNGTQKGIYISGEGKHKVRFEFIPISFYIGLAVSILTLLVFVSICVLSKCRHSHKTME